MDFKKENISFGQYFFDNHDFDGTPEEFLERTAPLIGYLIHAFNSLDAGLNSAICTHINDRSDEPGAVIIHKMAFSSKVDLFNNLVVSLQNGFGGTLPSFKTLIDSLKKCATLRNAVVHAEWDKMNEKGFTYVKMHFDKNGLQQQYWQFTPDSLLNAIEFIYKTNLMFDTYDDEKRQMLSR